MSEVDIIKKEIAEMQLKLSKLSKKDKGLKSTDQGVLVPEHEKVPSNPAYKKMSKPQFVKEMKRLKDKKAKLAEMSKQLDAEAEAAGTGPDAGRKEELAEIKAVDEKIATLEKWHHQTEKSLLGRIAALSDEKAKATLLERLEAKKKELEAPKE